MFPRNAVMERKIFMAERKMSSLSTPLKNSAEQTSSLNVFWFSSLVKFLSVPYFSVMKRGVRKGFN